MVTLRELLGAQALVVDHTCPTGKTPYASKPEARQHLKRMDDKGQTKMRPYRCDFCGAIHIGHRRGAVL